MGRRANALDPAGPRHGDPRSPNYSKCDWKLLAAEISLSLQEHLGDGAGPPEMSMKMSGGAEGPTPTMPLRQVARPAARPPETPLLVIVPLEEDQTWSKLSCSLMDEFQGAGYDEPLVVHRDAPLAMSIAAGE